MLFALVRGCGPCSEPTDPPARSCDAHHGRQGVEFRRHRLSPAVRWAAAQRLLGNLTLTQTNLTLSLTRSQHGERCSSCAPSPLILPIPRLHLSSWPLPCSGPACVPCSFAGGNFGLTAVKVGLCLWRLCLLCGECVGTWTGCSGGGASLRLRGRAVKQMPLDRLERVGLKLGVLEYGREALSLSADELCARFKAEVSLAFRSARRNRAIRENIFE